MFKNLLLFVLLLSLAGPLAAAKGPTSEQRLARLERILQNQSLSDMVLQIERLQQEVQKLRGELETQRHALESQNRRQRDLYMDLDRRLVGSVPSPEPAPVMVAPGPEAAAESAPKPAPVTDASSAVKQPPATQAAEQPIGAAQVPPGDPALEKSSYEKAFEMLRQGSYLESIGAFRSFLAQYPSGAYADNAQYWLGEASYVTRDFDSAMEDFNRVLQRYPASNKVPGTMLKIGYIHYELRAWADARQVLEQLSAKYPSSTEARLARQRLERMRKENR